MLTIRAENAKSGRQRHIPLNVEAMEVLQRWARQAGERRAGKVFDVTDIKKGWGNLIADARIEEFRSIAIGMRTAIRTSSQIRMDVQSLVTRIDVLVR